MLIALSFQLVAGCESGTATTGEPVLDSPRVSLLPADSADSVLRHVVLFRFSDSTTAAELGMIEEAFSGLPAQIPEIQSFEWGLNNSPEGLDKGFTHAYLLTFASERDRAAYLPHPAHVAFTELVGPHVDDVHVVDYWSRRE